MQWNINRDLHTSHSRVSFLMTSMTLSDLANDTRVLCDSWVSCMRVLLKPQFWIARNLWWVENTEAVSTIKECALCMWVKGWWTLDTASGPAEALIRPFAPTFNYEIVQRLATWQILVSAIVVGQPLKTQRSIYFWTYVLEIYRDEWLDHHDTHCCHSTISILRTNYFETLNVMSRCFMLLTNCKRNWCFCNQNTFVIVHVTLLVTCSRTASTIRAEVVRGWKPGR